MVGVVDAYPGIGCLGLFRLAVDGLCLEVDELLVLSGSILHCLLSLFQAGGDVGCYIGSGITSGEELY